MAVTATAAVTKKIAVAGKGKSTGEKMGAESARQHGGGPRQSNERKFQEWKRHSPFRDLPMQQDPGPPSRGEGRHHRSPRGKYRPAFGRSLRQTQQRKRKREEPCAKSNSQIEKMVEKIVERTGKVPHRVNLPSSPVIPGGWPKPDPV